MKKTLVFVLVAAMLVSVFAVSASAYTVKSSKSGSLKFVAYEAATTWTPDGKIDVENGEYYDTGLTADGLTWGFAGDPKNDKDKTDKMNLTRAEAESVKFYTSWNGKDTVYFALTAKPAYLVQDMYDKYVPADGLNYGYSLGTNDDFCQDLGFIFYSNMQKDHNLEGPNGNKNWMFMAYARAINAEGVINPDDEQNGGLMAGSYGNQRGCSDAYNPLAHDGKDNDFFIDYDVEAGTVTLELAVPMKEAWNQNMMAGQRAFFSICMVCSNSAVVATGADHYTIAIGDYGYYLDCKAGSDSHATIEFAKGTDPAWTATGEDTTAAETTAAETTAAETTAADDTTVADTTAADTTKAEETTKKQETPVNPTTADITVLCLAAAASAIAVISKKRK